MGYDYRAKSRVTAQSSSLPKRLGDIITLYNIKNRIWALVPDSKRDITSAKIRVLENFKNSLNSQLTKVELLLPSNRERLVAEWSTGYMGITDFEESPFMKSFSDNSCPLSREQKEFIEMLLYYFYRYYYIDGITSIKALRSKLDLINIDPSRFE
jgi:hypothetical protein